MTISPGTRLGPYEVIAPLGAGGMGEVWRARDPRLGREVAVKVLPEELSADRERLKRFEREARAASALSHPNIVTIHEIGEADGRAFLVMERIEGQTLRELDPGRAVAAPAPAADRLPDRRWSRARPRGGNRSPGLEARERHGDERRLRQDPGFRPGKEAAAPRGRKGASGRT